VRDGRVGEVQAQFPEAPHFDALEQRLRQHLRPGPPSAASHVD
jgi:hypothetical protein